MTMLIAFLVLAGAAFMMIAAVGLLRLPDLYMRMSATTKAATLGVGMILVAAAIFFDDIAVGSRALATIVFLLLTAPVAAHMIGRAAYFDGVPLWSKSIVDELKGRYDMTTHDLAAPSERKTERQKRKPASRKSRGGKKR
jgi:multicomponent Na+:H+ antiporter subunit G